MDLKWKAVYSDGKSLNQYNEDGSVNKYPDIDRTILKYFELYGEDKLILRIHLEKERRLIYRRRVAKSLNGKQTVVYFAGWQKTIGNENIQSIAYIFEDGHIEMAGQWKGKSNWFYAPNLIKEEKDGSSDK